MSKAPSWQVRALGCLVCTKSSVICQRRTNVLEKGNPAWLDGDTWLYCHLFSCGSGSRLSLRALTCQRHTCCSAQLHVKSASATESIGYQSQQTFLVALRQRVFTATAHVALYCSVSDLTPVQGIKQHNRDSHGTCGDNYLSHLPTESYPIWNSFLCEFSRLRGSIRLLHLWSGWRTLRRKFKRHLLRQLSESQESTKSWNDLVYFVRVVSQFMLMSDVCATTFSLCVK